MPTRTDVTVVNSAYDTSGNGGRKLVRLSNGWLVAVLNDTTNKMLKIYKSTDNGATWTQVCYISRIRDASNNPFSGASIASFGTKCVVITPYYNSSNTHTIGAFVFDAETIGNIDLYGTAYAYDISLENGNYAIGATSVVINNAVTEIHAAWASKNNTYPNSFNIRYAKGTINADGSVTWGAVEQVTQINSTGFYFQNPSIILDLNGVPTVLVEQTGYNIYLGGVSSASSFRGIAIIKRNTSLKSYSIFHSSWSGLNVYLDNSNYAQSSPSACVDKNGRIWVAWHGTDATDNVQANIRVSYSDDGGVTWSSMTKLTSGNTYGHVFPTITVNKNNEVFIVCHGRDASNPSYESIRMIKYNGSWGSISVISSGTSNKMYPSTLYDLTLDFSTPLFIYKDVQNNKVGFYGTWTITTISVTPGYIGQKTSSDKSNILSYSITTDGTMSTITEKINGTVINTRTGVTSGQQLTVSLSQAQWDAIPFGKYAYRNLVPNFNSGLWTSSHQNVTVDSSSKITMNATAIYQHYSIIINVKQNTDYTLSVTHNGQIAIYQSDLTNPIASYTSNSTITFNSGNRTQIAVVLGSGSLGAGTYTFENVMLNEGTTAKPFVPFGAENTLTIEMGTEKWEYTFDKRLNANDDILSAIKAAQDLQTTFLPAIKAQLASAIRSKGGTVNDTDAWSAFVSAVANMANKRVQTGTVTSSSSTQTFEHAGSTGTIGFYTVTATGLTFKPSLVFLINTAGKSFSLYSEIYDGIYSKTVKIVQFNAGGSTTNNYNMKGDVSSASVTSTGFTLPVYHAGANYTWFAFE